MTPFVTWGTNPGQGVPLGATVPAPTTSRTRPTGSPPRRPWSTWASRPARRCARSRSTPSSSAPAPTAGSRTCALAAEIIEGRHVAADTRLLVVPGSVRVRLQAEDEGLDVIFKEAGAEWRGAGCSMCLGMNPDQLAPGERSASTSNRNFEGRQGKGGRTHLVSVPVAAATAVRGTLVVARRPRRPLESTDMEKFTTPHRHRRPAAPQQRRHRPDHPGGLPQAGHPRPASRTGCSRPGATTRPSCSTSTAYAAGSVLVAGPDFGTGSSREHAVWALQNYGFKVVISPRFGDIFRGNSGKAGLLAAQVDEKVVQRLWDLPRVAAPARPSPSTSSRGPCEPARASTRSRTPSTSTTTRAGGCSRVSTTSASRSSHEADIAAFEAGRPSFKPATL